MKRSHPDVGSILCILFLVSGIFLRIKQFLLNCSLDVDEARIAADLLARSFLNIIFHEIAYVDMPTPPIGLMLLEKLSVFVFGADEWAFRIVPLISSLIAVILFYQLIRKTVRPPIQWFPLGLFALNDSLIKFAASAKQYSSDALCVIILILIYKKVSEKTLNLKEVIFYGVMGIILMFFSYTSVFMLGGVMLAWILQNLKNKKSLLMLAGVALIWADGFIIYYVTYFHSMITSKEILESAQFWFMPRPFVSLKSVQWVAESFMAFFRNPLGINPEFPGIVLCLAGLFQIFRNKRSDFCVLFLPLLAVFIAACLRKYPFFERYLIFLIPILLMVLTEGFDVFTRVASRFKPVIYTCLFFLFFNGPFIQIAKNCTQTQCPLRYREVLTYLKDNARPDDLIFLNQSSQLPFWYYGYVLGINRSFSKQAIGFWDDQVLYNHRVGRIYDYLDQDEAGFPYASVRYEIYLYNQKGIFRTKDYADYYAQKVYRLYPDSPFPSKRKQRVWVLFLFAQEDLKKHVVQYFRNKGQQTDGIKLNGSTLYLFEIPGKD